MFKVVGKYPPAPFIAPQGNVFALPLKCRYDSFCFIWSIYGRSKLSIHWTGFKFQFISPGTAVELIPFSFTKLEMDTFIHKLVNKLFCSAADSSGSQTVIRGLPADPEGFSKDREKLPKLVSCRTTFIGF